MKISTGDIKCCTAAPVFVYLNDEFCEHVSRAARLVVMNLLSQFRFGVNV